MNLDTIRVFAISKLGWIKQQQKKLRGQERETPREYLDRESHYVWGKRYLLQGDRSAMRRQRGIETQQDASAGSAGHRRGQEAGDRRPMVSRPAQESRAAIDREVGAAHGREGGAVLRAEDENEMGKLQRWV